MPERYIGLMSGTSTDGVDGVVLTFGGASPVVEAFASVAFPKELREALLALNTPAHDELHRAALAGNQLAHLYAQVVRQVLRDCGLTAKHIAAIGVHGQTVRHRPGEFDGIGYTLQINQPALLAEMTSVRVIADFRSRDVAAAGQGAPLVPAFHDALFAQQHTTTLLLNIGGIANLSVLPPRKVGQAASVNEPVRRLIGFDCGPGNALLDFWCQAHTGAAFDVDGQWGASGKVHPALLRALLDEPFFVKAPPKSTGRDLFNESWLGQRLVGFQGLPAEDVQATLVALTAQSAAKAIMQYGNEASEVLVCGGGAFNLELMRQLSMALPHHGIASTQKMGLGPMQVEAAAFAWLARQHCHGLPANLSEVTGAHGSRVLGASYPA